jgi:hypothetical protein
MSNASVGNADPDPEPDATTQLLKVTVAETESPALSQVPTIPTPLVIPTDETVGEADAPDEFPLVYWSAVTVTPLSTMRVPPALTVIPFRCWLEEILSVAPLSTVTPLVVAIDPDTTIVPEATTVAPV